MKTISFHFFTGLFVVTFSLVSCSNNKKTDDSGSQDEIAEVQKIPSVNIYDWSANGLQVLEDCNNSKSHLTYVKFGEEVSYLGEVCSDTTNKKEYCKIQLSDGTTGWARNEYIIKDTRRGAVIEATPVYERPDILTKSSKKQYEAIEIVAVIEEKDNWYNVIGKNNRNKGWVPKENVSLDPEDVDMAIIARKELFDSKGNIRDDKLNEFINSAHYPGSKIVNILRNRLIDNMENSASPDDQEGVEIESDEID